MKCGARMYLGTYTRLHELDLSPRNEVPSKSCTLHDLLLSLELTQTRTSFLTIRAIFDAS